MSEFGELAAIDYVERWRQLVRARSDQGRRLDREHNRADHWAGDRAARFRRMVMSNASRSTVDPFLQIVRSKITADSVVLDVGAGAGRHVLPIANEVRRVIAVEPSEAMRGQLEAAVRDANLTNVTIVGEAWPTKDVESADVVICSHVLYFVEDVGPFLERLRETTRNSLCVVLRHEQRERAIMPLFEQIWHEPRCPEPTFVDLGGVASQLGIWGSTTTIPFSVPLTYDSIEDIVAMVRRDVLNPTNADAQIERYVRERAIVQDETWVLPIPPAHAGVFTWDGAN